MVLLQVIDRAVGMISVVVLARLLVPEAFGLLALAWTLVALVEMLGALSVENALVREPHATPEHFDTAWTIRILVGILLTGLVITLAAPAAVFFDDARVQQIIYGLALANFIGSFENIGTVKFAKELDFNKEFAYRVTVRVTSTVVTIILAFYLRNYWALVAGTIFRSVMRTALSYRVQSYRPRFSLAKFSALFHFSKWLLLHTIIDTLNSKLSTLVIGRVLSTEILGFYMLSADITYFANDALLAPVRRAVYPGFAKIGNDITQLRKGFIDVFSLTVMFGIPIPIGIALTAPYIVTSMLGEQWLPIIPLLQVLPISAFVATFNSSSGLIYLVLNRPQIPTILAAGSLAITIPLLVAGIMSAGALGAAAIAVLVSCLYLIVDFKILFRILNLAIKELVVAAIRPIVAVAVMTATLLTLQRLLPIPVDFFSQIRHLTLNVFIGAVVYTGTIAALWHISGQPAGAERNVLNMIREKSRSWFSSRSNLQVEKPPS